MNLAVLGLLLLSSTPVPGFFVTSVGRGGGAADLGGLAGADRHCGALAAAAGLPPRTWRAYLSAGAAGPVVHARDRIGGGPWANVRGVVVAGDLTELHSDRNAIDRHTALTEKGETVAGRLHDVLTGSDEDGRLARAAGVAATCSDWTSAGDGTAMMGHHDRYEGGVRFPRWMRSWNASHTSRGCDAPRVARTGSAGLFYCFAADPAPSPAPPPSAPPARPATFARGVNVAHWLSHNVPPDFPYAGAWFDEKDVVWIAAQGFDHLRVRIAGDRLVGKDGDVDEDAVRPLDDVLRWARAHGLGVVLTMFSLPGFRTEAMGRPKAPDAASPFTDEETGADAAYVWWQVARRYAREGDFLRFEALHRPGAPDAASMAAFNRAVLGAVRRVSPDRFVYLASRDMTLDTAAEADVAGPRTGLAVAFWEPSAFTFQHDPTDTKPLVPFPSGTADAASIEERLARFAESVRGRAVYVAEWGVHERAADDSARRYVGAVRDSLERNGLAWAVYDYASGCAVRKEDGTGTRVLEGLALSARSDRGRPE